MCMWKRIEKEEKLNKSSSVFVYVFVGKLEKELEEEGVNKVITLHGVW